jgi:hypothetical protein
VELKHLLAEMKREGAIAGRRRRPRLADALPPVLVLRVTGTDAEGDLWAVPAEWEGEGAAPRVLILTRRDDAALGAGDRLLGRLVPPERADEPLAARVIRRIGMGPKRVIGIYHAANRAGGSRRSTSAPTATGGWSPATGRARARANWSRPSRSAGRATTDCRGRGSWPGSATPRRRNRSR